MASPSEAPTRRVDRRRFLQLGGLGAATAAVLAACGKDETPVAETGTTQAPDPSTTAPPVPTTAVTEEDQAADLQWLQTATSTELLAVDLYDQVVTDLPTDLQADARTFRDQHQGHAEALQALTRREFGAKDVYEKPNAYLKDEVFTSQLASLSSAVEAANGDRAATQQAQAAYVQLLADLETTLASSYLSGIGAVNGSPVEDGEVALPGTELRQAMAAIAGPCARRAAVFNLANGNEVPDSPLFPATYAIPNAAVIGGDTAS